MTHPNQTTNQCTIHTCEYMLRDRTQFISFRAASSHLRRDLCIGNRNQNSLVCVFPSVCVRVCVCSGMHACLLMCLHAWVHALTYVWTVAPGQISIQSTDYLHLCQFHWVTDWPLHSVPVTTTFLFVGRWCSTTGKSISGNSCPVWTLHLVIKIVNANAVYLSLSVFPCAIAQSGERSNDLVVSLWKSYPWHDRLRISFFFSSRLRLRLRQNLFNKNIQVPYQVHMSFLEIQITL